MTGSSAQALIPVVDVFAGPGGLNEGFSAARDDHGRPVFRVAASFEMEPNAVETLVLRSAVRDLSNDARLYEPYRRMLSSDSSSDALRSHEDFRAAEERARQHVHHVELGPSTRDLTSQLIRSAVDTSEPWVLIGGPPCQAYSLVGRSRRAQDPNFEDDHKHFLYREYLEIIKNHEPAIFVMENVKGLLSAVHGRSSMFDLIREDLQLGGKYHVRSFVVDDDEPAPREFVIRSEMFGVPQRRHRVILLGIRQGVGAGLINTLRPSTQATVRQAIGDLPNPGVRVSRATDEAAALRRAARKALGAANAARNGQPRLGRGTDERPELLARWLNPHGVPVTLHESRRHMEDDLARYAFLAHMAEHGLRPRVTDLPLELQPRHRNIHGKTVPFVDRFKVQTWDEPSSTVASHIAKDGHYYIHPDPAQMRSLTVREAARLQTFPDDYHFVGTRTLQYHQVGNAVPPLLAVQLAEKVAQILGR